MRADAETLARCAVLLHCEAREVPQRVRALIRERELLQGKGNRPKWEPKTRCSGVERVPPAGI